MRFRYFLSTFECWGGLGCGWGLVAPAHRSSTILWPRVTCYFNERYCLFFGWLVQRLITVELKIVKNDQKLSEGFIEYERELFFIFVKWSMQACYSLISLILSLLFSVVFLFSYRLATQ